MASTELSSQNGAEGGRPLIVRPREGRLSTAEVTLCQDAFTRGGLIAFPTDTVYGVGVDAGNPEAVRRLFEAKRRPPDKPLPVLVGERADLARYGRATPSAAWALAEAFWPGPLTMIVLRGDAICRAAVAGGDTVGLRMPDHAVALQLLRAVGGPMAVTSANPSGEESTIGSAEVLRTLGPWLEALVADPGVGTGLPSTVIDLTVSPPRVLRWGAVTLEQLVPVIGEVASPRKDPL